MIINTHCHLNSERYSDEERLEIIKKLEEENIIAFISGYDLESSKLAVKLSRLSKNLYCNVGISPNDLEVFDYAYLDEIKELAKNNPDKVIGIGEIGLDYYYSKDLADLQKDVFIKQIDIANELNLPIIIHSRDASGDTIDILKNHPCKKTGIMHCYSYSDELSKIFVKLGYFLAIGGVVTFKNARVLKEVVVDNDINNLVFETDCPYLTPEPFRGQTNYAYYVTYVIDKVCELKNMSKDEVLKVVNKNVLDKFEVKYEEA